MYSSSDSRSSTKSSRRVCRFTFARRWKKTSCPGKGMSSVSWLHWELRPISPKNISGFCYALSYCINTPSETYDTFLGPFRAVEKCFPGKRIHGDQGGALKSKCFKIKEVRWIQRWALDSKKCLGLKKCLDLEKCFGFKEVL